MPDFEPQPISKELNPSIEQKITPKIKSIAEQLGDYTQSIVEGTKNASERFLERTWHTQNAGLLCLESIGIKSLLLVAQHHGKEIKIVGKVPSVMSVGVHLETVIKRLRADISVGEHMSVHPWHFRSLIGKDLSDGTSVKLGQKIGVIHFVRNLPVLGANENPIGFSRRLFKSGEESLRELAALCESNDSRLTGIDFFYGMSHLAGPLAKRLGFDVFEIENPIQRAGINTIARYVAKEIAKRNNQWQRFGKNFKFPREAFISRQKLVELYGSKQSQTSL